MPTPSLLVLLALSPTLGRQEPVPLPNPTETAIKRLQEENEKLRADQSRLAADIESANRNIAAANRAIEDGANASAKTAALDTLKTEVARKLRLMNVKEAKRLLSDINGRNTLALRVFDRSARAIGILDLCVTKAKEKAFANQYASLSNLFDVDPTARALIERAGKEGGKSPEMMTVVKSLVSGSWGSVVPIVTGLFAGGKKGWTADVEFVVIAARLTDALADVNRSYKAQIERLEAETLLTREGLMDTFARASAAYSDRAVSVRDYAAATDERRYLEAKVAGRYAKDQASLNRIVADGEGESAGDAFTFSLPDDADERSTLEEVDAACAGTRIAANSIYGIETSMVNALKAVQRDIEERLALSKFAGDKDFQAKSGALQARLRRLVEAGESIAAETRTTVVGPARGLGR